MLMAGSNLRSATSRSSSSSSSRRDSGGDSGSVGVVSYEQTVPLPSWQGVVLALVRLSCIVSAVFALGAAAQGALGVFVCLVCVFVCALHAWCV
jgi:hypothetical protein